MTGYLYRGSPALEEINAAIMAEREAAARAWLAAGGHRTELGRRSALRKRDIPADCICGPYQWSARSDRWVLPKTGRISCGAEIDHYLGCPDDPNPDYEAEAEVRGVRG